MKCEKCGNVTFSLTKEGEKALDDLNGKANYIKYLTKKGKEEIQTIGYRSMLFEVPKSYIDELIKQSKEVTAKEYQDKIKNLEKYETERVKKVRIETAKEIFMEIDRLSVRDEYITKGEGMLKFNPSLPTWKKLKDKYTKEAVVK